MLYLLEDTYILTDELIHVFKTVLNVHSLRHFVALSYESMRHSIPKRVQLRTTEFYVPIYLMNLPSDRYDGTEIANIECINITSNSLYC